LRSNQSKTVTELLANAIPLPSLVCPSGTIALTAGIDPGQGGFWFAVLAWRPDMSPHLTHYGFMVGWEAVAQLVWNNAYQVDGEDRQLGIWRAGLIPEEASMSRERDDDGSGL